MRLRNFFYDCDTCNYTLRFDDTAQVRICPKCGSTVQLSPTFQQHLISERAETEAEVHAKQLA